MNATKITITLAELGIMSIAAIGCASNAVSADDELNIESAPVIGAPSDPSGSQGIAVGEINPATPGTSTSTPVDYPILDHGIRIFVPKRSFVFLAGTELDFSDGLNGKGFVFYNPNAKSSCGCGNSFSV